MAGVAARTAVGVVLVALLASAAPAAPRPAAARYTSVV
jgi:hypothetical protein